MNFSILRRSISATLFAAAMTVSAQSFTVHMTDGSSTSYDINDVENIEFEAPDPSAATLFKEPANTFIVTKGGEYEFYAKRPSGSDVDIVKADWIWGSKVSDNEKIQSIIRNVRLEDGKVKFTASGNEGTAVIAGFDAAGTVKWVWLIWSTDRPTDFELASGTVVMDRYMGATSSNPKDGTQTWASVVYQWGRPVPLFSGYGEEYGAAYAMEQAKRATIMNPDYDFQWEVSTIKPRTVEESIAYPTTFFSGKAGEGDPSSGNWLTERHVADLWVAEKNDYDPSPAGYQIPSYQDWGEDFFNYITPYDAEGKTGGYYTYNDKRLFLPNGVKDRLWDPGEIVIGYPGFMMWASEYRLYDYLGILESMSLEQALSLGLIDYWPTRVIWQYAEGAMVNVYGVGNPAFAHPILCKRIEK